MIEITDASFETQVTKNEQLTIVDFYASWCGPCIMLEPILEEVSKKYEGRVTIGKLNIEENPQTLQKMGVRNIPTLVFMKSGQEVDRIVGAPTAANLESVIEKHLQA